MKVLSRKAVLTQGAVMAFLAPKLAQDAKLPLFPIFEGLSSKNFKERKPGIVAALKASAKDKLAKDASIDDVAQLLDALEEEQVLEGADTDPNSGLPMEKMAALDGDPSAKLLAFLKGKISDADYAEAEKMCKPGNANDEPPPTQGAAKKPDDEKKDMVTKPAMDAAIAVAVKDATTTAAKNARESREAERAVRPYVGDLAMAHDSAEGVYRAALTTLGVKVDGVHPSAFRALLEAQPLPTTARKDGKVAMDSANTQGFLNRYPDAARIGGAR